MADCEAVDVLVLCWSVVLDDTWSELDGLCGGMCWSMAIITHNNFSTLFVWC